MASKGSCPLLIFPHPTILCFVGRGASIEEQALDCKILNSITHNHVFWLKSVLGGRRASKLGSEGTIINVSGGTGV